MLDAVGLCKQQAYCAAQISESRSQIVNELIAHIYEDYASLSVEAKALAKSHADQVFEIAARPEAAEFSEIYDLYYKQLLPQRQSILEL